MNYDGASVTTSVMTKSSLKSRLSLSEKFQSNNVKLKIKQLFKNIDKEKSGTVKKYVFFEILDLHKIKLSDVAKLHILNNFSQ